MSRVAARPHNLLLITLDTMRADRLPAYGFTGVETPALDRIAAEGTVFEEAFAAVPLTLPSHASLFTGLYPPRLGVRDNAARRWPPSSRRWRRRCASAVSMYPRRSGWTPLRSLRADRYKLIDAPRDELYDLVSDPDEERNVLGEHPTVAAAMLGRLRSLDSGQEPTTGAETDNATLERIRSLGYVGRVAGQVPGAAGDQSDPKDNIEVFNRITSLQWDRTESRRAGSAGK